MCTDVKLRTKDVYAADTELKYLSKELLNADVRTWSCLVIAYISVLPNSIN